MDILALFLQAIIGFGILNVWLLRFGKPTEWRGGTAANMKEEFATYGLPGWALYAVGFLKVLFALMLLGGIFASALVLPAASGMAILMLGAVVMHVKVGDSAKKSLPAGTLLVLCIMVIVLHLLGCSTVA